MGANEAMEHHPASSHEAAIAACIRRIRQRHDVAAVLAVGESSRAAGSSTDWTLVVLTANDTRANRARFYLDGVRIDLFLLARSRALEEIDARRHPLLNRLLSEGVYVQGDRRLVESVIKCARTTFSGGASPGRFDFRAKTQPFDLLRSFQKARSMDHATAALAMQALVAACLDVYCDANNLSFTNIVDAVSLIRRHDPRRAELLVSVLEAPIGVICGHPDLLESLVQQFVGCEPSEGELWLVPDGASSGTHIDRARTAVRALSLDVHPAATAIRTYEASKRMRELFVGAKHVEA